MGSEIQAKPPALVRERRQLDKKDIEQAHSLQVRAGLRGAAVWGFVGSLGVYAAHHLSPSFRHSWPCLVRLISNAAASAGLVFAAEHALQHFEYEKRTHDNLIRNRAMRELGQRGIVASEREIEKWQEEQVQRELGLRRVAASSPP